VNTADRSGQRHDSDQGSGSPARTPTPPSVGAFRRLFHVNDRIDCWPASDAQSRIERTDVTVMVEAMADALAALRSSVDRLTGLVRPLDDASLALQSYPTEWSIADVMSHIGSGAVISRRRIQASLDGTEPPDDFNQRVWDEWNAKSPRAKADDAVAADNELIDALEATPAEDRARFKSAMGPFELDWNAFVGMRLNEHLLHEWDVAVTLDPTVPLASDGTEVVVDNLDLIARFTAKPKGDPRTVTLATADPVRTFAVAIEPEQVSFSSIEPGDESDFSMPAESLIRLVYGRLDPDHSPPSVLGERDLLDQLRAVFPGP
jgi:uncharacterized protein (TIGR03083 family)